MPYNKLFAILLCFTFAGTLQAQDKKTTNMDTEQCRKYATKMNDFAFDLYRRIAPQEGMNDNIVCSPMSVYLMMGILANGADGNTLDEINRMTELDLDTLNHYCEHLMRTYNDMTSPTMETASFFAVNKAIQLLDTYKELTAQHFLATAETMNFNKKESLNRINGWCKQITRGLIPSIIEALTPDMLAVLMNAVYFKGKWVDPFNERNTRDRDFQCEDGTVKKCKQMFQGDNNVSFLYAQTDEYQLLRMPYEGQNKFHMTILLPTKGRSTTALMKDMTADKWCQMKEQMRWEIVYITMPLFSFSNDIKLKAHMKALGMESAFSNGANFSRMSRTPLKIDDMFQKARIEVNETGTEAAAVTAAVMLLGAAIDAPQPVIYRFIADHPFIYTIEDGENGNIVFIGEYRGK